MTELFAVETGNLAAVNNLCLLRGLVVGFLVIPGSRHSRWGLWGSNLLSLLILLTSFLLGGLLFFD
jgi:hypothetical protein